MLKILEDKKEQARFSILFKIVGSKNAKVISDEKDYMIAQSDAGMPVWIWTVDGITESKFQEMLAKLEEFVVEEENIKITAKKEIFDLLSCVSKVRVDDYFEMGSYYCDKTIKPKECEGKMELATINDLDTLTKYRINELKELEGVDGDYVEIANDVKSAIEKKNFYVWKNNSGKIVCTSMLNISGDFARINKVYTPVEDRCKGYAQNIIYSLTNLALEQNYIPVLYTDYNYPASNKAYMKVGYEDLGKLINFSIKENTLQKTAKYH